MRVVLITGKGGVGKTTVACATAVRAADLGHRTLVLSTDAAHSLGDVLDASVGHEPTELAANLHAQQLDGRRRLEESWSEVRAYLVELLGWAGADAIDAAELACLPGLDELFALENLCEHASSGRWDAIVVDCAPSAETLRLLSLPEVIGFYLERIFPTHRRVARLTRPVLRRATSMPLVDDAVLDSFVAFIDRIEAVRSLLTDPEITSARLVTVPERVVVAETRRTFSYLALFGYPVDALIVNRCVAPSDDAFVGAMHERQTEPHNSLRATFEGITRLQLPLLADELTGVELLRRLADDTFVDLDPVARLGDGRGTLRFERHHDGVDVVIPMHGIRRDEVHVGRTTDELVVTAGAHRRCIALPDGMAGWPSVRARFEAGELRVHVAATPEVAHARR